MLHVFCFLVSLIGVLLLLYVLHHFFHELVVIKFVIVGSLARLRWPALTSLEEKALQRNRFSFLVRALWLVDVFDSLPAPPPSVGGKVGGRTMLAIAGVSAPRSEDQCPAMFIQKSWTNESPR